MIIEYFGHFSIKHKRRYLNLSYIREQFEMAIHVISEIKPAVSDWSTINQNMTHY